MKISVCKLIPYLHFWLSNQIVQAINYGFQSGNFHRADSDIEHDTSNSFASALHYDPAHKAVYVVGSTYWSYWDRIRHSEDQISKLQELDDSDCFFAMLTVPEKGQTMDLVYTRRFGKSKYGEACSALSFIPSNGKTKVITTGHTNHGGFLTSMRGFGTPVSTVYGFLLSLELDIRPKPLGTKQVTGTIEQGNLMNDHEVQYPIAVTTNPFPIDEEDEIVYVVALSSGFKKKNPFGGNIDPRPDKSIGGVELPEYGTHYSAFIKQLLPKSQEQIDFEEKESQLFDLKNNEGGLEEKMRPGWTELLSPEISLDYISTEHYLQISDLKYVPRVINSMRSDCLILIGTTSGYGSAFGGSTPLDEDEEDETFRYKAGFVTAFDLDGTIMASTRIEIDEQDVVFKGACIEEGLESVDYLYIVGETRGLIADDMKIQDLTKDPSGRHSKHSFITKLNLNDLSRIWTRQVGGTLGKDVLPSGCAVAPFDEVVYMAGTVVDGDKLRLKTSVTTSAGGDDIFVANYLGSSGEARYIKQIGSSKDDWLASGDGIVTDDLGNAIVLGNSMGSMMRWREDEEPDVSINENMSPTDIFLFSIGKDNGVYKTLAENSVPTAEDDYIYEGAKHLVGMDVMAVIVGALVATVTSLYVGYNAFRFHTKDKRTNDRTVRYLEHFHDSDFELHLRNSATGGVHAVYGSKKRRDSLSQPVKSRSVESDIDEVTHEVKTMNSPTRRRAPPRSAFQDIQLDSGMSFESGVTNSSLVSEDSKLSIGKIV